MASRLLRKVLFSAEDNSADENKERGNWTGRFDNVLALMGAAIGLGNLWRFPYLCYRNGGGAFLIPFLLMMLCLGFPLFLMQAALAQYSSSGPTQCWRCAPLFKGLGPAIIIYGSVTLYYNMILAWATYFFFASFTGDLPWQYCGQPWNTPNCMENAVEVLCTNGSRHDNGTCEESGSVVGLWNRTLFLNVTGIQPASPAREYFTHRVLRMANDVGEWGPPAWDLALCFLFTWLLCCLCMAKGIKTSGRVVYVTATLPFLLLLIFLIRGVTLTHALTGIRYFIIPDFARLGDARVWQDAVVQVFYTMGISGGSILALNSYNKFHNNVIRDTLVVGGFDLLASLLSGFVIFSYLGHLAGTQGVDIDKVAVSGSGLAFEVYPMAVTKLPLPTLWSLLFFLMLLMLGLDSEFAMIEVVLTGILDSFPQLRPRKTVIVIVYCMASFLLGLPLCGKNGVYWVTMLDNHVCGWTVVFLALFVFIAVIPVYGPNRLYKDMEVMLGYRPSLVWKICWVSLSPITLAFLVTYMLADYSVLTMGDYRFPAWSEGVGWLLSLLSLLCIPGFMVLGLLRLKGLPLLQRLRILLRPTADWGPALREHRLLVKDVPGFQVEPGLGQGDLHNGVEEKQAPLINVSAV